MINVSKEYLESMKLEENNIKHHYTIKNVTRELDLTELVMDEKFTVKRFLRTAQGTMSPNTLQLELRADANTPADVLVKDFYREYKEFKGLTWKQIIYQENIEEYLVRTGDIIVIDDLYLGEEIRIFTGKVKNVIKTDTMTGRKVAVTVDDNTIKGYEYFFSDDVEYENYYIYNSENKEKSLLYVLCTQFLEFKDDELEIQDIKDEDGKHIIIPFAKFQKGTRIMEEIAQLVRSFYGNLYTIPNGNIRINTLFDRSYIEKINITLGNKKGNYPVLYFIENSDIVPVQNKVEVKYSNSVVENTQVVASIRGQHATTDDSKLKVPKNKQGDEYWRLEFKDVTDINKNPIVKAYIYNEENNKQYIEYTEYQIEFNGKVAKVKFNNSNNYDIFIEKFDFIGKPVFLYNDNSVSYTEIKDLALKNTNLKSIQHKYIVSKEQATMLAKHTFYNECRPYNKIRLRTNNMPFLELEDVIKLDFKKYNGDFQIIAIDQNNMYTELVLKEYKDYQANYENFITEKTSNLSDDTTKYLSTASFNAKEEKMKLLENDISELKETKQKLIVNTTQLVQNELKKIEEIKDEVDKKIEPAIKDIEEIINFLKEEFYYKDELFNGRITSDKLITTLRKIGQNDVEKIADLILNNARVKKILAQDKEALAELSRQDKVLEILYNNAKICKGASQIHIGKFIILEISSSNSYSVNKYGEALFIDGQKRDWRSYRDKFKYFKQYPYIISYAKNDTESDDYFKYIDLD